MKLKGIKCERKTKNIKDSDKKKNDKIHSKLPNKFCPRPMKKENTLSDFLSTSAD